MTCGLAEWAVLIGIVFFVISTISGAIQFSGFLQRLRTMHPPKWQDLGKPELVMPEGSDADKATFVFILKGYYRDLKDPLLTKTGDRIRIFTLIDLVIACIVGVVLANQLDGSMQRLSCLL